MIIRLLLPLILGGSAVHAAPKELPGEIAFVPIEAARLGVCADDLFLLYANYGFLDLATQNFEGAAALLGKAVELKPSYFKGWEYLGLARAGANDFPGAVAAYSKAWELDPANAAHYAYKRGPLYLGIGKPELALKDFDLALKTLSSHASIHRDRSMALLLLERYDESERAFTEAVRLDPSMRRKPGGPCARLLGLGRGGPGCR